MVRCARGDCSRYCARYCATKAVAGGLDQIGREFASILCLVLEWEVLRIVVEPEVERVQHRHLGDQVNRDLQLPRGFIEHQPSKIVGLRVLLPVDEMLSRLDPQRVRQDPCATMGRRTQTHHLRAQIDGTIVAVVRDVVERDMNRHKNSPTGNGINV